MVDSRAQERFLKDTYYRISFTPTSDPILEIYHQLINFSNENLVIYFRDWLKHFSKVSGISIQAKKGKLNPFLQLSKTTFIKPKKLPEAIRIYVPFKSENIKREVEFLFDELAKREISHDSKIMPSASNTAVEIRVAGMEELNAIASIANTNYSQDLLPLNPFVLNYNNVGVILDYSVSFNKEIARLIYAYFTSVKGIREVTLPGFNQYIEDALQQTDDKNRQDLLKMLVMITKHDYQISNFLPITSQDVTQDENNYIHLIKDNYKVYGSSYVKMIHALYLCGSTMGFSKPKRSFSTNNLTPEMIKEIIARRLSKDPNAVSLNDLETYIDEIIKIYNEPTYIEALISTNRGRK